MAARVESICEIDTSYLQRRLAEIGANQLPFALAKSLTDIAKAARLGVQSAMQSDLDNPTPFTLNSLYVKPATKANLISVLAFKDPVNGTSAGQYLVPEVLGGLRLEKPFEKIERSIGVLPTGKMIIPGAGMRLNRYGNVSLAQLEPILQAATGVKFAKSKRKAKAPKKQLEVFVGSPAGGRLPMGIWQRLTDGSLKPLFVFVSRATYKARLPVGQIAGGVFAADFPAIFDKAFADAVATAKP